MYAVIVTLSHQQQHLRNSAKVMGNVVALPGEIVSISILHKKITLDTGQLDHSVVTRSVKKPEEVDQWSTLFPDQQGEVTCRVARWLSSKYRTLAQNIELLAHALSGITIIFIPDKEPNTGHSS